MGLVFESLTWDLTALVAVLLASLYLYFVRNFGYWKKRGVPYLQPTPFLGNVKDLFLLKMSSGGFLMDIYKKMPGKPYAGFFIFDKPALVIRDPSIIKRILVKDFNVFADRFAESDVHVDPLGSKNLFCIKGQPWKNFRTKLSSIFTSGKMKKMFHLVDKCDSQMIEYLERLNDEESGKSLDIKEIAAKCTTDVVSTCVFGINSNSLQDPNAEFREIGKKTFEYTIFRALEVNVFFFVPSMVRFGKLSFFQKETNDFLHKVFWDTIEVREKSNIIRNDLIDLLIQLKNQGFSDADVLAQAAIFFVAGYETSASTMSFTLFEMATHPELQQTLRNEITEALKKTDGKITYEMVFGLKYLDMVISEALRKYPTLPFLDRVALKDYHIPETGLTIEKGTPVYVPVHGLQTDPEYYPDPQRFDPERFSDEAKKARTPFTYMPFGAGPHNCIGMRFGMMSAKTGVVHILSKFQVEASEETPNPLVLNTKGILISTVGGVPLVFKKSSLL